MVRRPLQCFLTLVCFVLQATNLPISATNVPTGTSPPSASEGTVRRGYVGDASCIPCHKTETAAYQATAHHLTSQLPSASTILGSFAKGSNRLTISSPELNGSDVHLYFDMEAKNDGYYQTAIAERGSQRLTRSQRIDIVVGSGVRGQTYLWWAENQLFELPVSYWTDGHRWINSPGYEDGTANYARHVDPRCLECHATYIKALSTDPQTNLYDRNSLVIGISCESCHGPGAEHVARAKNRVDKQSRSAILNPANFDRDRQVDQCALCHNGTTGKELLPAFSYLPGQPLDNYLLPNPADAEPHPDVHGNQVGLLKRSLCYLRSPAMTCSTCHDVHAPERSAASYSDRCLRCHQWQSCGVSKKLGSRIAENCIDCHMPLRETNAIASVTAGKVIRTSIRSHWIQVYYNENVPRDLAH